MGTSTARELTCDRPASYPGGVMYSHPLALRKPGISTGLMSLKAREGFNLTLTLTWPVTTILGVHTCIFELFHEKTYALVKIFDLYFFVQKLFSCFK